MKTIQIVQFLSTGIRKEFNTINTIEIQDKPFAEGGFGIVFHCISVNGNKPSIPQVIKIYKESQPGSADENATTIKRLQTKLSILNADLIKGGKSIFIEFPAFKGIPQFSFDGVLDGAKIKGFASDNLVSLGFQEFGKILSPEYPDLQNQFDNISVEYKLFLAYQLTSAFRVLDGFHFIHADLKPEAIFVNLKNNECAIIDFDSGVITENTIDEPTTWGAPNDWVAPEIWQQQSNLQNGKKIHVDTYTDRWSVAVGVSYLLTGLHPLFYLTELSPRITGTYFSNYKWPNIDTSEQYFEKANLQMYNWYVNFIESKIPSQIIDRISVTINYGYKNPGARSSYKEWESAFKSNQNPPEIHLFVASSLEVFENDYITLSWKTLNASSVTLNSSSIPTINSKKIQIKRNTSFEIIANGFYGSAVKKEILIKTKIAPQFVNFQVDASKIKRGNSVRLSWEIQNASSVKLSDNFISSDVSLSDSILISPDQTSNFKLTAIALDGKTAFDKHLSVEVFEAGKISYFKADRQFVFPTIPVTLSWEAQNAIKVEIEGIGNFQLSGQTIVCPTIDTSYILKVTDNFETITEQLQVKMLPLPVIERLIIKTPIIHSHSNINITVADLPSTCFISPKLVGIKHTNYDYTLETTKFPLQPVLKDIDFTIEKIPLLTRVRNVLQIIKRELNNEKNRKYVSKL